MRQCYRTISAALLCAASMALPAFGQVGTGFIYQGRLTGAAAFSSADLQFRLFGTPAGGVQVSRSAAPLDVGWVARLQETVAIPTDAIAHPSRTATRDGRDRQRRRSVSR